MSNKRVGSVFALLAAGMSLAVTASVVSGCNDSSSGNFATSQGLPQGPATAAQVSRGQYIVAAQSACQDCHGQQFQGFNPQTNPQGAFQIGPPAHQLTILAANISQDPQTGIGNWTNQQIYNALKIGKDDQGKTLCPPMPWPHFSQMTDADLWSVVAYLRTVPAVQNAVPSNPDCSQFYGGNGTR